MVNKSELLNNINKLHTTILGKERIKRNLGLTVKDEAGYCKALILKKNAIITKKGKNWYITVDNIILTVNSTSYTIITAHKI